MEKATTKSFVLLLLAVLLAACSNGGRTYKIGVSQCSQGNWRQKVNREMLAAQHLYEHDVQVTIIDSYDDTEKGYFLFTDDANQFKPAQIFDVAGAKASYARQFTPGNVCTVVLPFAIGADVAKDAGKFYRINSIADGYIRGTEETPAPYVPYIFVPATEYPFTNIGIGQLPAVQNNSITTAEGYTLQFVTETTELASDASYDYYGFQGGKFVKAAYATVNPFRSYIKVAKSANAPATLIWTDDEATGISSLKADIQNGKADVYDLQGRRVLNPVRGLYIVNGKKVIVK